MVGEKWEIFWPQTGQWRPAKIINETEDRIDLQRIDLQFEDTSDLPDLVNTVSATRGEMYASAAFRRVPEGQEIFAWFSQVLQDETLVIRLVERGLLWLEWDPADKNYVVWMRHQSSPFCKLGVFALQIAPSRFGGNIGLTHMPSELLANLGGNQTS